MTYQEGLRDALTIVQTWRKAEGHGYEMDRVSIYEEMRFDQIEAEIRKLIDRAPADLLQQCVERSIWGGCL